MAATSTDTSVNTLCAILCRPHRGCKPSLPEHFVVRLTTTCSSTVGQMMMCSRSPFAAKQWIPRPKTRIGITARKLEPTKTTLCLTRPPVPLQFHRWTNEAPTLAALFRSVANTAPRTPKKKRAAFGLKAFFAGSQVSVHNSVLLQFNRV